MRMKSRLPGHDVGSGVHHPVTRVLHWSVLAFSSGGGPMVVVKHSSEALSEPSLHTS
jgi:hypothetical protein